MSQHSSLKIDKWKPKRNVKKRWERFLTLKNKNKEIKSIFGLPKEKIIRLKIKKDKKEEKINLVDLAKSPILEEKKHKKQSKDITGIRR